MGLKTERSIVLQKRERFKRTEKKQSHFPMRGMNEGQETHLWLNHPAHTWLCFQQQQQWSSVTWLLHDSSPAHQHPGRTPKKKGQIVIISAH